MKHIFSTVTVALEFGQTRFTLELPPDSKIVTFRPVDEGGGEVPVVGKEYHIVYYDRSPPEGNKVKRRYAILQDGETLETGYHVRLEPICSHFCDAHYHHSQEGTVSQKGPGYYHLCQVVQV